MTTSGNFKSDTEILQRRNRELSILNSIAEALNRSIVLEQALHSALAKVAELLDLHTGWIWLLHEETGESYLAAAQNLPPALADNPRRMEGSCYCLDTYRAGDLDGAANVNVLTCSRLWGLVGGTEGLRYHASIPLYARGKQLGVLNLASTDWRELTPDDLRLLYIVGDLLSIAIERARLYAHSAEFGAAEERNRLAREIHDTLAQGLTGIALKLETADALLEAGADAEKLRHVVQQALGLTRANLEEARRSVLDLRAAPLEGRSLADALTSLAANWNIGHRTPQIEVDTTAGKRPLPIRIETGLFRISQEALNNIAQHANARHIRLQLVTTPQQVTLRIRDDGQGFDPSQVPPGSFGLIGLNERAKLMGGQLQLHTGPGEGTGIEVIVPLGSHAR
jgi:two-component system NarL family sensor kinase